MPPRFGQILSLVIAAVAIPQPSSAGADEILSAMVAWSKCTNEHAIELVRLAPNEPTDSIIAATLTECLAFENAFHHEIAVTQKSVGYADVAMKQNRADAAAWLRPLIIREKAKK